MVPVKVKVTNPPATPVTTPPLVTLATAVLLLIQLPPDVGDKVVVPPGHIEVTPVISTVGKAFTVTGVVVVLLHPVMVLVNVKYAVPAEIPVTIPASVTWATTGLLLIQVPPVVGDRVVVPFSQIVRDPVTLTVGRAYIVTADVVLLHPEEEKVKLADPGDTPVTTPLLVTEALPALLLVHVPPVVGDKTVVPVTQSELTEIVTSGAELIVTFVAAEISEHPSAAVTLTV
jgi:hypothetical protein